MKSGSTDRQKSWLMRCKAYWLGEWFDPHTSFLKLPSFWAPFIIILLLFSLLCWKVASDNGLVGSWNWTVQEMYEWFKIPFWVLALLIPVIGLFNANHKSEQARAAMELTKSQNNFANYFKHLEEFTKFVKEVGKSYEKNIEINIKVLHSDLFPCADIGDYKIFTDKGSVLDAVRLTIRLTNRDVKKLIEGKVAENGADNSKEFLDKLDVYFLLFKDYFVLKEQKTTGFLYFDEDENQVFKYGADAFNRVNQLHLIFTVLNKIVAFDPKVELPLKDFHNDYKNAFVQLMDSDILRRLL